MTTCPKCGCDWEKWHHRLRPQEGYHCINCGNYLCYLPSEFANSGIDGLQSDKPDKPLCFGMIESCPFRDMKFLDNCPYWRECRDYTMNRTKKPNPSRRDSLNHDI